MNTTLCWFCGKEPAKSASAEVVKLKKQTGTETTGKTTRRVFGLTESVVIPRCPKCAKTRVGTKPILIGFEVSGVILTCGAYLLYLFRIPENLANPVATIAASLVTIFFILGPVGYILGLIVGMVAKDKVAGLFRGGTGKPVGTFPAVKSRLDQGWLID